MNNTKLLEKLVRYIELKENQEYVDRRSIEAIPGLRADVLRLRRELVQNGLDEEFLKLRAFELSERVIEGMHLH